MTERMTQLEVLRYNPETDGEPRFQRYEVPYREDWVVLDALNYVKENLDPTLSYRWCAGGESHELAMVPVPGTRGSPFLFGAGPHRKPVDVPDFAIATTPVTQALWLHLMGSNPSRRPELRCPVENVSWDHISGVGGFLERINSSEILSALAGVAFTTQAVHCYGQGSMRFPGNRPE